METKADGTGQETSKTMPSMGFHSSYTRHSEFRMHFFSGRILKDLAALHGIFF